MSARNGKDNPFRLNNAPSQNWELKKGVYDTQFCVLQAEPLTFADCEIDRFWGVLKEKLQVFLKNL